MDIMFMLTAAAIILTCFYLVISPFYTGEARLSVLAEQEGQLTLDMVYGAVNELEMDYLMKKINERDFNQMKERYHSLASDLMKKENERLVAPKGNLKQEEAVEIEILRELQKLRKQKGR